MIYRSHASVLLSTLSLRLLVAAATIGLLIPSATAAGAEEQRFEQISQLLGARADWVSVFDDRIAFGAGNRVSLARTTPTTVVESRLELDAPALEGVLSWNRLFLNDGRTVRMRDLSKPLARAVPVKLRADPRARLRLARHGDNLVVAEDGAGLRFVKLPMPPEHHMPGHHHDFPDEPIEVGLLDLQESFTALASFGHRVYAAIEGGGIAVVDGRDMERPRLTRRLPTGREIDALAVNGSRLYALGPAGLTIINLRDGDAPVVEGTYPDLLGSSIQLTGRMLHIAGEDRGWLAYRDQVALATTHFVTILGITFNPANIAINVGDTVQWDYAGGISHNVESCDGVADPAACTGVAAEGQFIQPFPMTPTGLPFSVSHTFTVPGGNPYFCVVHVNFGMVGSVTVNAAAPPGVPDGSSGTTPMTVGKAGGSSLSLSWDVATCPDASGHQIVSGAASQLPTTFLGSYGLSDAVCSIGTTGAFVWAGPPSPLPGDFSWFLVVANDGSGTEGPWGTNSGFTDRQGPGPGGSSGLAFCNTAKDLGNACGQ